MLLLLLPLPALAGSLSLEVGEPDLAADGVAIGAMPGRVFVAQALDVIEVDPATGEVLGSWPARAGQLAPFSIDGTAAVALCTPSGVELLRPDSPVDTGAEPTVGMADGSCGAVAADDDVLVAAVAGTLLRWEWVEGERQPPIDLALDLETPRLAVLGDDVAALSQGEATLHLHDGTGWSSLVLDAEAADVAIADDDDGPTAWASLPGTEALQSPLGTLSLVWPPGLLAASDVEGDGIGALTIGRLETGGLSAMGTDFDGALYLEQPLSSRGLDAADLDGDGCDDHVVMDRLGTVRVIWTRGCNPVLAVATDHDLPDRVEEGERLSGQASLVDDPGVGGTWELTVIRGAELASCTTEGSRIRCDVLDDGELAVLASWVSDDGTAAGGFEHAITLENVAPTLEDSGGPAGQLLAGAVTVSGPTAQRLVARDPGDDTVTFDLQGSLPDWFSISSDGRLQADPDGPGSWSGNLTLRDEDGGASVLYFTLESTVPASKTPVETAGDCGCSGVHPAGAPFVALLVGILGLRRRRS
ncbi:MAG: hypothetical protein H6742_22050 [Alphaproteobacteria bacterium]|nr:hypothetical protein [Alphaproteobacteria bacterium]